MTDTMEDQVQPDPFASTACSWHPALSEQYKLPSDVYYPLVDGFLQDEKYAKWSAGYKPWQLHCFGGPGCGKVRFAFEEDIQSLTLPV
jgi:hypothetical protein